MKLWGGRFGGETDDRMRALNDSFAFDRRLYAADIRGSIAYAGALLAIGLLTADEQARIAGGLEQVRAEFDDGRFMPRPTDEDIHTAVERRLTELIGPAAGKLHTGRSRNDQVALDLRLWLMERIDAAHRQVAGLQTALVEQAEAHLDIIMPGYTHLQPAQPILFSHWLLSFFWMLERDQERLDDCQRRTAVCPLGSGALAGNPFPIDRSALAEALGMAAISPNSLDAVGDRDFAAEFLFDASLLGVHLSRLAEDLILFSGPQAGFVTLAEEFTTGSSLMPQKRNPDALELARGKSGRLLGSLVGLLTTLKGLPSSYNKDLQEVQEPLFDAADTLDLLLPALAGVVGTLTPNADKMAAALDPSLLATDLADALVRRGIPFREAHEIVGRAVRRAEERGVVLDQMSLADLNAEQKVFEKADRSALDFKESVARRGVPGGTAPSAVRAQIAQARACLARRV
jgi:argininosuccinate lyase